MSRQEDFFNEATKQIRYSYVFQSEGTYSDDDVRDIATSLAEYGYQYAIKKTIEFLKEKEFGDWIEQEATSFVEDFRKSMEE